MATRLHAARLPIVISLVLLLLTSLIWQVPFAFTLAGAVIIIAATAFVPRRTAQNSNRQSGPLQQAIWPDTSMKATINAVRNPAFILDTAGIVRFANDAAAKVFSETRPGDLFSLTFRSPALIDALRSAAGGRSAQVQYREHVEGASVFNVEIDPVRRPGMKADFLLLRMNDITEQIALGRMRADFVANASHELRTPLASLTGFVETLLGPARDDRQASEKFLKIMLEQAERMRRLIDDLLSLSRLEMRAHSQLTDLVDLVPLVHHVRDALAPVAQELDVTVDVDLPSTPLNVRGDADELTQVLQNLIENGLKYGDTGGRLDINAETRTVAGSAVAAITVRDYGPGIAEEHLPRLTERFYRVDVESSRQKNGTGLGLAIVKHIVAHHRGRLSINSVLGEGATFTIELPLADMDTLTDKNPLETGI